MCPLPTPHGALLRGTAGRSIAGNSFLICNRSYISRTDVLPARQLLDVAGEDEVEEDPGDLGVREASAGYDLRWVEGLLGKEVVDELALRGEEGRGGEGQCRHPELRQDILDREDGLCPLLDEAVCAP